MRDVGSGTPLVLIPGIQGRWEWLQPAIDALAKDWRVISCSLPGEPGSGSDQNGDFDSFIEHIDGVLDAAGIPEAVVCGVSFGGLIAVRYAARRQERVRALILVSAIGPRWRPDHTLRQYMKRPILSSPLFFLGAFKRFWPELSVTYPSVRERASFCVSTLSRVLAAPTTPFRMSQRARMAADQEFETDCAQVSAPTLVIAGEPQLDRVVRHDDTLRYLKLIDNAVFQTFRHTGHLGTVSAPREFRAILSRFATEAGLSKLDG